MSTRACYKFTKGDESYLVYKHHEGYPAGASIAIRAALQLAWDLPRFEPDEFAAAFVAANKKHSGGVRLMNITTPYPMDIEFFYEVAQVKGKLQVTAYNCDGDGEPEEKPFFTGSVDDLWAEEIVPIASGGPLDGRKS